MLSVKARKAAVNHFLSISYDLTENQTKSTMLRRRTL